MEHDQPVPLMDAAVSPLGRVSETLTAPAVAPVPLFLTVMVYVAPVWPWVKLPTCELVTVRSASGRALIVVRSVAESFAVLVSPPPLTPTELATDVGAVFETFTVRVIAG